MEEWVRAEQARLEAEAEAFRRRQPAAETPALPTA